MASRFLVPSPVLAQAEPKEVKAQSFVLVDDQGHTIGTFTWTKLSQPGPYPATVVLLDPRGKEIWRPSMSWKLLGEK